MLLNGYLRLRSNDDNYARERWSHQWYKEIFPSFNLTYADANISGKSVGHR